MLKNVSLSTKLLLILLLPLTGFLLICGLFLTQRYQMLENLDHTVTASATAQGVSVLITRLQHERDASGAFLSSDGTALRDDLRTYRQASDQARNALRILVAGDESALQPVLKLLDGLPGVRTKVDGLTVSGTQSSAAYTEMIQALIGYNGKLEAEVKDPAIKRALNALNLFVELKERAGRERALLGIAFSRNRLDLPILVQIARNLGEFTAYADAFRQRSAPEVAQRFDNIL